MHWLAALLALACAGLAMAQRPSIDAAWALIAQGKRDEAVVLLPPTSLLGILAALRPATKVQGPPRTLIMPSTLMWMSP